MEIVLQKNSYKPPNTNPEENKEKDITKKLFKNAMKGEWKEVVEIYTSNAWIHKEKITKSGCTALHIAVSDGQEEVVVNLVNIIIQISDIGGFEDGRRAREHAAACGGDPGKREYVYMHSEPKQRYDYCRRKDGETILHSAISGDYFDLAYQIIHLYEELVNSVNVQGLSPLHLLAAKPSAFRSGSHLGRCKGFVYHCIFVDELKVEKPDKHSVPEIADTKEPKKYPPNYETCYNLIGLLVKAIKVVTRAASRECINKDGKTEDAENPNEEDDSKTQGHQFLPPNYSGSFEFVKLVSKAMLIILGLGSNNLRKLREKKQKHTWSIQVMNELLQRARMYEYEDDGTKPIPALSQPEEDSQETKPYAIGAHGDITFVEDAFDKPPVPLTSNVSSGANQHEPKIAKSAEDENQAENEEKTSQMQKKESPILIAAKNGITEIVGKILEEFPVAIHDMNYQKKNVVLLAVENRQPHVYQLLLKKTNMKESVFRKVDHEGNSALHLAARLGEHKPWLIPGAALQMQWEIKWYEFVKDSMPFHFFVRYNKDNKSPREVFTSSHEKLVNAGGDWLTNTSESCSVVAALIATVAFATSSTVPGGVKAESGTPTLENQPAFNLFAISSLVALCFSVTALVMFLAILTSRYQEQDFGKDLPRRLLVGLTSLFVSIASMLVSFCAGHFFVLRDKLKYAAFPVYALTCLPITFFAIAQFPLYFDLVWATSKKVPQRSYKSIPT
ncbi:hypothetical protein JRO89_XS01G0271100 [Xanthoceras sorbifolium]|uniref:PGG domain-containing protein n=1 Tax=Xanthoceras sorbifolium TaxID=99658 RepID=A0ABQ8ILR1_9ROSI|nr:hypothetical protein JRO89_XS01G0271100 [Xanthoceras sorbifolium]